MRSKRQYGVDSAGLDKELDLGHRILWVVMDELCRAEISPPTIEVLLADLVAAVLVTTESMLPPTRHQEHRRTWLRVLHACYKNHQGKVH